MGMWSAFILLFCWTILDAIRPPLPIGGKESEAKYEGHLPLLDKEDVEPLPTVLISLLVRNKAHTLPYFLGQLEDLDYDKGRISLFIRTDNNVDGSDDIIAKWVSAVRPFYRSIDFESGEMDTVEENRRPFEWPESRMRRASSLKDGALIKARSTGSDYVFLLDCDQFLTYPRTLQRLMNEKKTIIAPLLGSKHSNYSNFWAGVTEQGYYKRTDDYYPILSRQITGCFPVPMVHSSVLIDFRKGASGMLTFDPNNLHLYSGPVDDLLVFAASAQMAQEPMYVLNTLPFGFLLDPAPADASLLFDVEAMRYLALESLSGGPPGLLYSPLLPPPHEIPGKLGFDEIYLINLNRRPDRRRRMEACFQILGINATHWPAVDGRTIDDGYIRKHGISMLPEYQDPYHKRTVTAGEIGCFMSHYHIWEDVVRRGLKQVIVFEDDLRFVKYFRQSLQAILNDIKASNLGWDLIYLGRKRLNPDKDGPVVEGNPYLYHVSYSYWTLAYALSLDGAEKLLAANPLKQMVPVDEYLPIMFDRHPEADWAAHFPKRNLKAFTAEPLLLYPTHYTGDKGYISDTEDTSVVEAFTELGKTVQEPTGSVAPPRVEL